MERHKLSGLSFLVSEWPVNKNKPVIFFIHAAGSTALSWIYQVEGLREISNVIAVDLPGHGQSTGPGFNKISDYAKVLVDLIDKLDITTCIPAGISMGGAIVQQMLLDYPGKFKAGILINTGAKIKVLPNMFEAIRSDAKSFMGNLLNFVLPVDLDAERFSPLMDDLFETNRDIVLGDFSACDVFDVRDRLENISVPVLVVSSGNDAMTPVWYGEYLEQNIKNAVITIISDAGHLVNLEKPEQVNTVIIDFINKNI